MTTDPVTPTTPDEEEEKKDPVVENPTKPEEPKPVDPPKPLSIGDSGLKTLAFQMGAAVSYVAISIIMFVIIFYLLTNFMVWMF